MCWPNSEVTDRTCKLPVHWGAAACRPLPTATSCAHGLRAAVQGQRVYEKLRVERMNARREGMRKKRAADAAAEKDK